MLPVRASKLLIVEGIQDDPRMRERAELLAAELKLRPEQRVLYAQTVGYPAEAQR